MEILGKDLASALATGLHPQCHGITYDGQTFLINGGALEPEKLYTIVTNSYVWSGKDNYDGFENSRIIKDIGLDMDLVSDFLAVRFGGDYDGITTTDIKG